ncbi:MAG: hypothetical protein IH592_06920 [Bacteroidales bacterium]|nr:hypothetical protein [Bacteroidales bacterium]
MRRAAISVAVLLFLSAAAMAQEIKVTSSPDTAIILIGDQTRFTVTAKIPAGTPAELNTVTDTLAGKIIILSRSPRDTVLSSDGNLTITDRYLVTAFDSGAYTIPPFYAEMVSGDSLLRYYSDYSFLTVLRPDVTPPDTTDVIFDIIGPRSAPVTFAEVLPWLVIALIAGIVLFVLARFLPRNPLRRFVRPAAPPEPADVIALRELKALMDEELWQKGEVKEYYSRLSDITRRYIDNRYGISSPELTTDETVRMLQKAAVTTGGQMSLVKDLLSLSDMVKFAKYVPDSGLHEKYHADAVRFVKETRVAEIQAGEEKAKGGADA